MTVNKQSDGAAAMDETPLLEDAEAIAALMPKLARSLFTADHDPADELPLAQLRVCGMLAEGPRPMSALGRELRVSLSAMTQIADRLERVRLVRRVAEDGDRRVRCLQLTPRGAKIMRQRRESRTRQVLAALGHLGPHERKQLVAALETLLAACQAASNPNSTSGAEALAQS
jgi:DNA-binding MarR family transcriptional regulator